MNITKISKETSAAVDELIQFLDAPHGALAWPGANPWAHAEPKLASRTLEEKLVDAPSTDIQLAAEGPTVALKGGTGFAVLRAPDLTL